MASSRESRDTRSLIEAGEYKKAIRQLWDLYNSLTFSVEDAEVLRELATRIRDDSRGRVHSDAEALIGYAEERIARPARLAAERQRELDRLAAERERSIAVQKFNAGIDVVALGGFGWDLKIGEDYRLLFDQAGITVGPISVSYGELVEVEVGGPGRQESGGRFVGGGTGVAGAIGGMLVAGALNAASKRSAVLTTLSLHAADAEAFFAHSVLTPYELRVHLSEVFVRMRLSGSDDSDAPGETVS